MTPDQIDTFADIRSLIREVNTGLRYDLVVSKELAQRITLDMLRRLEEEFGKPVSLIIAKESTEQDPGRSFGVKLKDYSPNPFLALAMSLWARGEDGEVIATDLVQAFNKVAEQAGNGNTPAQEYARLSEEIEESDSEGRR